MNRLRLLAIVGCSILTGCASNGPTAAMTRIETFARGEAQLRELYAQHHAPLVVVGHGIYLPPPECLGKGETRSTPEAPPPAPSVPSSTDQPATPAPSASADREPDRKFGGLAEQRVVSGAAEQRLFGGGTLPIKCMHRGDRNGFEVIIPNGGDVRYFDGQSVHDAPDHFVPLR